MFGGGGGNGQSVVSLSTLGCLAILAHMSWGYSFLKSHIQPTLPNGDDKTHGSLFKPHIAEYLGPHGLCSNFQKKNDLISNLALKERGEGSSH